MSRSTENVCLRLSNGSAKFQKIPTTASTTQFQNTFHHAVMFFFLFQTSKFALSGYSRHGRRSDIYYEDF